MKIPPSLLSFAPVLLLLAAVGCQRAPEPPAAPPSPTPASAATPTASPAEPARERENSETIRARTEASLARLDTEVARLRQHVETLAGEEKEKVIRRVHELDELRNQLSVRFDEERLRQAMERTSAAYTEFKAATKEASSEIAGALRATAREAAAELRKIKAEDEAIPSPTPAP